MAHIFTCGTFCPVMGSTTRRLIERTRHGVLTRAAMRDSPCCKLLPAHFRDLINFLRRYFMSKHRTYELWSSHDMLHVRYMLGVLHSLANLFCHRRLHILLKWQFILYKLLNRGGLMTK